MTCTGCHGLVADTLHSYGRCPVEDRAAVRHQAYADLPACICDFDPFAAEAHAPTCPRPAALLRAEASLGGWSDLDEIAVVVRGTWTRHGVTY